MEMLHHHEEDFSSLLQNICDLQGTSCASESVVIIHLANEFKSIHAFRKNINSVALLTRDALLHHFRKQMFHRGIGS